MMTQTVKREPFYVIDRKKELSRKKLCRFGILEVQEAGAGLWRVHSDSGNDYIISHIEGRYECDCPYGIKQQELADFSKDCRHVKAVKRFENRDLVYVA